MIKAQCVAIIGAGSLGSMAALNLSAAGVEVHVFERGEAPVQAASRVNEGKIHQGLIYAKDGVQRTARRMGMGAVSFWTLLTRYVDVPPALSTPFLYAIHRDTMIPPGRVIAHMRAVYRQLADLEGAMGMRYLGRSGDHILSEIPVERSGLNTGEIVRTFHTTERAIDPRVVSEALCQALTGAPRIVLRTQTDIEAVHRRPDGKFEVRIKGAGAEGPFDQVVNAAWDDRLRLDQGIGLPVPKSWSYRHKFGTRVLVQLSVDALPSITMVLGPFGDIVNFRDRGLYLSWYPHGMVEMTHGLSPPNAWWRMGRAERLSVFQRSLAKWKTLHGGFETLDIPENAIDPVSGIIYSLGDTDISDADSLFHKRFDIGITSDRGYHSVDTGKYTMFPLMARQVTDRILGRETDITSL